MAVKRFDVLRIMTHNGWQWLCYEKDMLSTTTEYTQYCHLWEKRNVTDDDYPERRTDE